VCGRLLADSSVFPWASVSAFPVCAFTSFWNASMDWHTELLRPSRAAERALCAFWSLASRLFSMPCLTGYFVTRISNATASKPTHTPLEVFTREALMGSSGRRIQVFASGWYTRT
jgi:hypothetical protein